MAIRRRSMVLWSILQSVASLSTSAQGVSSNEVSERCEDLRALDFSQTSDAPTQVMEAKVVSGTADDRTPYCEVSGYVAPTVGFLLRLPAHWNGKILELGCGAACGSTAHIAGCKDALSRGYACTVSDGGHRSQGGDVTWAHNNPGAVRMYFAQASHATALASKAIVERYYDRKTRTAYFMGCSSGGIQGMWEAQAFPHDFDGIVAGGPALHLTEVWMNWLWANRALKDAAGKELFTLNDLDVLNRAVIAKCDMNDGIEDGLIGDPRACQFAPAEVRCTADRKTQCLTAEQVRAAERVYGGAVTSKGTHVTIPAAMKGSELSWPLLSGDTTYVRDWFRYANFQPNPGPSWKTADFDFDTDPQRLGVAESWEPTNPDLRKFRDAGGKLLMFTGWNDVAEGVLRTVDYYETAERILGSRASVQTFFRLFVIPGMNHCFGGSGASVVDYLSYMEAWVETQKAPDVLIASHVRERGATWLSFPADPKKIEFSRPVYPYPTATKYLGSGNPAAAASFGPVQQ